jgi:hypothetical protein
MGLFSVQDVANDLNSGSDSHNEADDERGNDCDDHKVKMRLDNKSLRDG